MTFRLRKNLGLAALLIFLLASCKPDGGEGVKVGNKVTIQNDSVPYNVTGQFLSIVTSGEWSIGTTADWCTLLYYSGKGETSNVITMEPNTTGKDRTAVFNVTFGDGAVISVTITQKAEPEAEPEPGDSLVSDAWQGGWLELPAFEPAESVALIEHLCTLNGSEVRNYSCRYDAENRVSTWVAYPLYKAFMGSSGRTDEWNYDPEVPKSLQPVYFSGVRGYDRGHQIPSADRTCNAAINRTTFYFTNLTPQNSNLNQNVWMNLEIKVRDWASACDTLYVVTGCVLKESESDELTYATDNAGTCITVPKAYYKVLLRYKKASSSFSAIGFWYENKSGYAQYPAIDQTYTVREIERRTGENFFPNLPDDIEETVETEYKPGNWLQ